MVGFNGSNKRTRILLLRLTHPHQVGQGTTRITLIYLRELPDHQAFKTMAVRGSSRTVNAAGGHEDGKM